MSKVILKVTFVLVCIFFTICFPAFANDNDKTWVAIRLYDGGQKLMVEYYGQIKNSTLDSIVNHSISSGLFKLESTCWFDNDKHIIPMQSLKDAGKTYGYSNTTFFRVDMITRIVQLDSLFVKKVLEKSN
jgi:hypothetical protein